MGGARFKRWPRPDRVKAGQVTTTVADLALPTRAHPGPCEQPNLRAALDKTEFSLRDNQQWRHADHADYKRTAQGSAHGGYVAPTISLRGRALSLRFRRRAFAISAKFFQVSGKERRLHSVAHNQHLPKHHGA